MIKIADKKNPSINLYSAKSANNSKNKYSKVKLGQNNNFSCRNKIRLSPMVINKKMMISCNNSQKRLIGNKINNSKIKMQNIKKENSMKNIKDNNNLTPNQLLKD